MISTLFEVAKELIPQYTTMEELFSKMKARFKVKSKRDKTYNTVRTAADREWKRSEEKLKEKKSKIVPEKEVKKNEHSEEKSSS